MNYTCPVCGYPELDEKPRTTTGGGSYEICPSCGFQFGVTDDDKGYSYAQWRRRWKANGMQWWSEGEKPANWNPVAQLAALKKR
jgi:hypothetical protein